MRRLLSLALLALVAGAVYVAVTQPEGLPFEVPWVERETQAAPPETSSPTTPPGGVTDAAIEALVATTPATRWTCSTPPRASNVTHG